MSVVYFIQAGAGGAIKIGVAEDISRRVAGLQTGCPDLLTVLAVLPGTQRDERRLHSMLRAFRHRGEWFKPAPQVLAAVEDARQGRFPAEPEPVRSAHFSHIANIVELFRARMNCRGQNPSAFALSCGLHRNTLLGFERDDWNPNLKTLLAIERRLSAEASQADAA
jgi:DNA-binding XRE family transcriptional regulator